jgi:Family of unknown function (DUF6266)
MVEISEGGEVAIQVQRTTQLIMSIAQNPMTGQMRKSMGNFNTYVHNGQNVISSKAFNRKDRNSDSQKAQRARFKLIGDVWSSLGGLANAGFPNRPKTLSPFNMFMTINLPSAIDSFGEEPVIDYRKMLVAKGNLPGVEVNTAIVTTNGLTLNYNSNTSFPAASETDEITLLLKTIAGGLYFNRQPRGVEGQGSCLLTLPNVLKEEIAFVYVFVSSQDGKKVSNSLFVQIE